MDNWLLAYKQGCIGLHVRPHTLEESDCIHYVKVDLVREVFNLQGKCIEVDLCSVPRGPEVAFASHQEPMAEGEDSSFALPHRV